MKLVSNSETKDHSESISDSELHSLTQAILKRQGIDFTCYEPKSLKRRVAHVIYHFKLLSVAELTIKILQEPQFIYSFMDQLSVGLTSMFRDPELWQKVSVFLLERFKRDTLNAWHAGCSTGEEVFTMGIVLRETSIKAKAFASDISKQSLEVARKGIYYKPKMEEYEANYRVYNPSGMLADYYKEMGVTIQMDLNLIKHVTFVYQNLITDSVPGKFDIIFCRNVMIYFDIRAKRKLFDKFYHALNPDGLFIIGSHDATLPLMDENKFKVVDLETRIFLKVE